MLLVVEKEIVGRDSRWRVGVFCGELCLKGSKLRYSSRIFSIRVDKIFTKYLKFYYSYAIINKLLAKKRIKVYTQREILSEREAMQLNPVTLAFVGDAVYSLYVRERLTLEVGGKSADLQRVASKVVSAQGQSEFLDKVMPLFTEAEGDVFRRGKNAKKGAKSKSASSLEYNRSTGFEAVLGYLYLTGKEARIKELLEACKTDFSTVETAKPFRPVHR